MRLPVVLLLLLNAADAYKILVYNPRFSQSISNTLGNIADTLVDAGHDVTSLILVVKPSLRDGTLKSKKILVEPRGAVKKRAESNVTIDFFGIDNFSLVQGFKVGQLYGTWARNQCEQMLDEPGLMGRIRDEQYDVMIVENFDPCGAALSHIIKPRSLITTAGAIPFAQMFDEFGLDRSRSFNPSLITSHLDVHSFWSRLTNLYAELVIHVTWGRTHSEIDRLFHERFTDFPGVKQICSHAAYTFGNSEPLIDYATPTLNRVLYIGGIGAKEPKKLDDDLDRLFTLRKKTVLISFGSVVMTNAMPLKVKETIVEVISRFPEVTFLWKYETPGDDFAKSVLTTTINLHMLMWTPQNDILADARLTAFITHGGMASTQEVALRGKPGLFIPFMGDQPRNAGMMERSGVGRVFDKLDLFDAEKLYTAVKDLLENDNYRQNALRISKMIQKKPFSARETLIRTVEFAAEFGPSPALRPQSFDMSWLEYHNVDIIIVSAISSLIMLLLSAKLVVILARKVVGTKAKRD